MIPAKKFGGKVTQYFIGFGPTVWSKQRGETEYGVKAIPLGGYVKIVGMLPPGAEQLADERDRTTAGQPGHPGPQVQHRHVHPADLRRARRRVGAHRARGQRPPVLQDAVVEEGHRDGRRADGEHPDRVLHLPRRLRDLRQPRRSTDAAARRSSTRSPTCVLPYVERRPGVHRRRPGRPGRRTPACSPATRSSASTAPRSPAGTSCSTLIRDNDNGDAVIVYERDGAAAHRHHQHHREARPTSSHRRDPARGRLPRRRSRPPTVVTTGRAALHRRADGSHDRRHGPGARHAAGQGVGRRPGRSSALEERDPDSPVSIVGGGRFAGETVSHDEFPSPRRPSSC